MIADSFASLMEIQCRAALISPKFTKPPEVIDEEFFLKQCFQNTMKVLCVSGPLVS